MSELSVVLPVVISAAGCSSENLNRNKTTPVFYTPVSTATATAISSTVNLQVLLISLTNKHPNHGSKIKATIIYNIYIYP